MTRIWKRELSLDELNARLKNSMCEHVGIVISELGEDFLCATMPVDARTSQYLGIVHGGANVVLAETVGSLAGLLCCKPGFRVVGQEINANHVRAGLPPLLSATARPLHLGNSSMVWDIRIHDQEDKLVCVSRLTLAVIPEVPRHRGAAA